MSFPLTGFIKLINQSNISNAAARVGVCLALAVRVDRARIGREKITERTGVKGGQLTRAIAELKNAQLFESKRTGRTSIYQPCKNSLDRVRRGDIVDGPYEVTQIDPIRSIGSLETECVDDQDRAIERTQMMGEGWR